MVRDGISVKLVSKDNVSHEKDKTAVGSSVNFSSTHETVMKLMNSEITNRR